MKIKAIIIDDESKSRSVLNMLLKKVTDQIEVCGEASSVDSAIKLIKDYNPQLVFLDIQMPKKDGFKLLNEVTTQNFLTIFVTSHEQYAIQAIKSNAFDYLLKPIDSNDLKTTVDKIIAYFSLDEVLESDKISFINSTVNIKVPQLKVHSKTHVEFYSAEHIEYIHADGPYSKIHLTSNKELTISKTLKELEEFFESTNSFIRINNSILANIHSITKYSKGHYASITLTNQQEFEISRRKKQEILERLKSN